MLILYSKVTQTNARARKGDEPWLVRVAVRVSVQCTSRRRRRAVDPDMVLVTRAGNPLQFTYFELFQYCVGYPLYPRVKCQNVYCVPCGCRRQLTSTQTELFPVLQRLLGLQHQGDEVGVIGAGSLGRHLSSVVCTRIITKAPVPVAQVNVARNGPDRNATCRWRLFINITHGKIPTSSPWHRW